ncbi:MAG: universal stress protein [Egibacteraceae bacterium]
MPTRYPDALPGGIPSDAVGVGSHGHSLVGELLLGSTSREVIRTAGRPVIVVYGPKGEGREQP